MHWLGGVLESKGYSDLHVVDFYRDPTFLSEFATVDPSGGIPRISAADVYLFCPMTVNLGIALQIAEVAKEVSLNSVTIFGGVVAMPSRLMRVTGSTSWVSQADDQGLGSVLLD
jgi:hypothetical protein